VPAAQRELLKLPTDLTVHERSGSAEIVRRLEEVRTFVSEVEYPAVEAFSQWHELLAALRRIQGNVSNDLGFFATLIAKRFDGQEEQREMLPGLTDVYTLV
jgi:hypothetical protein